MRLISIMAVILFSILSCYSKKGTENNGITDAIKEGRDILISNKTFADDIDLTNILKSNREAGDIFRANIASSITFENCIFNGKFSAYRQEGTAKHFLSFARNLTFTKCTFNKEANFRGIAVNGIVEINETMFNDKVVFEEAHFMNDAHFGKCFFEAEARFQNCFFNMRADFMNSGFTKVASFQGTQFNHDAQFGVTKFREYADFTLTRYNAGAFFNYAEFLKQGVFDDSKFEGRVEFLTATISSASLRNCFFFGDVKFVNAKVKEKLDIGKSTFYYGAPKLDGVPENTIKKEGTRYTTLTDLK